MTRLVTLPVHAAIEIAIGAVLMLTPFVLSFDAAGIVVSVLIGALLTGLALASSGEEGRGTVPIGAHAGFDTGLAFGLVISALLLGIAGDLVALTVLAAAGLALGVLRSVTRYSAVPA